MTELTDLETTIGITFQDKSLLIRALVHRSALNEQPDIAPCSNERLEFLGDAVLGLVTANYLYHRFPEYREGDLTNLRASLVRGETLAEFARQIDLGRFLYLSKGEESSGGRDREANLACAFEALVGAVYLDQGLEAANRFIRRFVQSRTRPGTAPNLDKDAKSHLQELVQGAYQQTPRYRTVTETGPDHAKMFTVQALLGERVLGQGTGRSKQAAEQAAAQSALDDWDPTRPDEEPA
ncbi:MAG: ribonuclease III [Chloroflexi bacterium]|nr:ribonuclease III [Chloroflexota bacterium]MBU1751753.1 ribonuclease III [Chloroflexota bacterium]MBU1877577.1 ribonuclease III [Chloroflexota bacterium]